MIKPVKSTAARLPSFVEPTKAKLVDSIPPGNWVYEIEFDGYRALALRGGNETRVLSRNEMDLGSKFPAIRNSIAALDVQDAIIDGEIVALDEKDGVKGVSQWVSQEWHEDKGVYDGLERFLRRGPGTD
jgi:bifunctional non-homologous end joining protein LigD